MQVVWMPLHAAEEEMSDWTNCLQMTRKFRCQRADSPPSGRTRHSTQFSRQQSGTAVEVVVGRYAMLVPQLASPEALSQQALRHDNSGEPFKQGSLE